MDMPVDWWVLLPPALFTLLAVILAAAVVLRRKEGSAPSTCSQKSGEAPETAGEDGEPLEALRDNRGTESCSQEQLSSKESQSTAHTDRDLEEKLCKQEMVFGSKYEAAEKDECASVTSVNRSDHEEPLRYMPGMLRTSQLEKMMSKEELEEERRVQQEQLAAIFKLLQENQDTFGEVTEKDMEDQLKLYSI